MKYFVFILCLSLIGIININAQSDKIDEYVKFENFNLDIEVAKGNKFEIKKFTTSDGKRLNAEFTSSWGLKQLDLKSGTKISGTYNFSRFASEGGLGTTRVIKGQGSGEYTFLKIIDNNEKVVGCPPVCAESVKIGLKIN